MDEHRVGLKPIVRRVWARRGQRAVVRVRPRYQWRYLSAFVHPASGRTWWLLLPTVRVELFSLALAEFARAVGAGPGRWIVLVLDGAGWHTGRAVEVPEGIALAFLPAYSPELQPAEHLWPLTDAPLVNHACGDIAELEERQVERCRQLQAQPERIASLTAFHWWPDTASSA
jgi:hypothetical protein